MQWQQKNKCVFSPSALLLHRQCTGPMSSIGRESKVKDWVEPPPPLSPWKCIGYHLTTVTQNSWKCHCWMSFCDIVEAAVWLSFFMRKSWFFPSCCVWCPWYKIKTGHSCLQVLFSFYMKCWDWISQPCFCWFPGFCFLAQNTVAGEGVSISHELINLEIRSPEVPDLTLIDLPGIARVAVGNQPRDIGDQVKACLGLGSEIDKMWFVISWVKFC